MGRVSKRESKRGSVRGCREVGRSCLPKVIARAGKALEVWGRAKTRV